MIDRLKAAEIGLVVLGLFLILGGWVIGPSGDVTFIFPFWLYVLGFGLLMGALYMYLMNAGPRTGP